ncbi:16S rRNA (guanine(527)-N(7))-methyltransferase RsmG [Cellulosimicrobium arenosum]|uniref:Ribosomal RNA small subunit methyltransferase G n=1 Tax=Cellulosimicrobium arenosum TaxID=2708133 RepID=A0A927J145_9MICO|nr:16S rRNA (guanine(527)-N(7))-methyltransferase RsmG [Cellulosimicrobium arenosum]MBD8079979.1 16S rRNA (guanine(527)-N(7))-methyltransferase RsmG [Cellulosimicrobium arenosum]
MSAKSVSGGTPGPAHAVDGFEVSSVDEAALVEYFGSAYPIIAEFAQQLETQGGVRGLIGPREVPRIWDRHILNSAAVVPFLPDEGLIGDLGSGAGLPGIVVAAMRPSATVYLVEPMERRCEWLTTISAHLGLTNVEIKRGRAEEFHGAFECDAVTSRAVAGLDKLVRISLPLLRPGGEMVVLKGRNVAREIEPARKVLRRLGGSDPEVLDAVTLPGAESTTVVRIVRQTKSR